MKGMLSLMTSGKGEPKTGDLTAFRYSSLCSRHGPFGYRSLAGGLSLQDSSLWVASFLLIVQSPSQSLPQSPSQSLLDNLLVMGDVGSLVSLFWTPVRCKAPTGQAGFTGL